MPKIIHVISGFHAQSLSCLVKYFREMAEQSYIPENEKRGDELTMDYCNELIEALDG